MTPLTSHKRILIVNIFGIGDVLFTTPVLRNIKLANPDAVIGYLCNKRTAQILRSNIDVAHIHIYEKDDFASAWKKSGGRFWQQTLSLFTEIKRMRYDVVIDVSLNPQAGFFAFLAGIHERIGFDYKGRGLWLTKKVKLAGYEGKHVIDFYLDLLTMLQIPIRERTIKFDLRKEDQAWAEQFLKGQGVTSGDRIVVLVPGGGASWGKCARYKRWPVNQYAKLADKIIEKKHAKIILIGDASEEDLCQEVADHMTTPCIKLFGKTSLGQFAALLARCHLAIVNDGGPLHIAVAVGTKTISIFGSVSEDAYGPYPPQGHKVVSAQIACRPCYRRFRVARCEHHQCLHRISAEDVFSQIGELA